MRLGVRTRICEGEAFLDQSGPNGRRGSKEETHASEREHQRVNVGEQDHDQAEDGQEGATDRLEPRAERHQAGLVPADEPSETVRRAERPEPVDHHRVQLRDVCGLGHGPLQDLLDLADLVAATLQEGFAFAIVHPGCRREPADLGHGRATQEETGARVGRLLRRGQEGRRRLVQAVRQVDEPVSRLDEADLVLAEDVRQDRAQEVAFRENLRVGVSSVPAHSDQVERCVHRRRKPR